MRATDVLIVGAGVTGLAAALACRRAGLSVRVLERQAPGAGASGGLVGALAPFQPDPWSAKKAFQATALAGAERYWAEVAAGAGIDPGYARVGRLQPLEDADARARAVAQGAAAARHWPGGFRWEVVDAVPAVAGWPEGPHGAVWDSLSARLHPRRAIAALAAALTAAGGVVSTGMAVNAVGPGGAGTEAGRVAAGLVVVAAGNDSDALLAPFAAGPPRRGVKGQAALLAGAPGRALLAAPGIYVVPHADGTTAVGSTREPDWTDGTATDGGLDLLLAAAMRLAPALAGARVLARWAGVRPRAPRPEPMLGWIAPGVLVATGSLGIGLGLAPALGAAIARLAQGQDPGLPPDFSPGAHGMVPRDVEVSPGGGVNIG